VPDFVDEIVARATKKKIAERYAVCGEFADALADARRRLEETPPEPLPKTPPEIRTEIRLETSPETLPKTPPEVLPKPLLKTPFEILPKPLSKTPFEISPKPLSKTPLEILPKTPPEIRTEIRTETSPETLPKTPPEVLPETPPARPLEIFTETLTVSAPAPPLDIPPEIFTDRRTEMIGKLAFFDVFGARDMDEIARAGEWLQYDDGIAITGARQTDNSFCIVVEGRAAVIKGGRTIGALKEGECFAEAGGNAGARVSARVISEGNTLVLKLTARALENTPPECRLLFVRTFLDTVLEKYPLIV
jgi:hypothetical protein